MGGRGAGGGERGGGYATRDNPKEVSATFSRASGNFTISRNSYGEGWTNGYHVAYTERTAGRETRVIDKGTVEGFRIGQTVTIPGRAYSKAQEGKIYRAEISTSTSGAFKGISTTTLYVETKAAVGGGMRTVTIDPKDLKRKRA